MSPVGQRAARAGATLALVMMGACEPSAALLPGAGATLCRRTVPAPGAGSVTPVRWSAPADDGRAAVRDAWCAAVGPALFAPHPNGSTPAPVPDPLVADSLAVISWNVHGGGGDVVALVADLRAGRWTGGHPVSHFVLLAQEVYRAGVLVPLAAPPQSAPARVAKTPPSGQRMDVAELAGSLKLALLYAPSMRNGLASGVDPGEDRGNAILSTLPLGDALAVELPFESQRRVAVGATVRGRTAAGEHWRLRLVSAHLDTRSLGRVWDSFGLGRRRQARALIRALPDDLPIVLAGDMNTWAPEPLEGALVLLRRRFPDTPPAPPLHTMETDWGFRRRLDYLFFRIPEGWGASYRRIDHRYGSDHYPLLGWVRFARPPTSR